MMSQKARGCAAAVLSALALAGCMSGGPAMSPLPVAAGDPGVDAGGLVPVPDNGAPAEVAAPAPASPAPLPRMWMSDFREAAEGIVGTWQVEEPRGSTCRLILEAPNIASREGRVDRRGGCFGDALFFADGWTLAAERELVLLDLMGRPLATLFVISPVLLQGEDLTLERASEPE